MRDIVEHIAEAIDREGIHPTRQFLSSFASAQMIESDPHVAHGLRLGVRGLAAVTGLEAGLGLHLWLLVSTDEGLRMRRYARSRSSDDARPNNWGDFKSGQGVVGTAWSENGPVFFEPSNPDLAGVETAKQWDAVPREHRFGMSWSVFRRTKRDFGCVVAVPVTNNSARVVGVVSANVGVGVPNANVLADFKARRWLEEVAATLWLDVPADIREEIEVLAQ
jgi:hypothetical protein